MTVHEAVVPGSKSKPLLLFQGVGYGAQEGVWLVVLRGQKENRETWAHGFQASANRELFVGRERRAYNSKVISLGPGATDSVVGFRHGISAVAGLSENIGARTEQRDVLADDQYAVGLRIVRASNHQLIRRRKSKTVSSFPRARMNA